MQEAGVSSFKVRILPPWLLAISILVWAAMLATQILFASPTNWWEELLRLVAANLAAIAFGTVLAALLVDRYKELEKRRAERVEQQKWLERNRYLVAVQLGDIRDLLSVLVPATYRQVVPLIRPGRVIEDRFLEAEMLSAPLSPDVKDGIYPFDGPILLAKDQLRACRKAVDAVTMPLPGEPIEGDDKERRIRSWVLDLSPEDHVFDSVLGAAKAESASNADLAVAIFEAIVSVDVHYAGSKQGDLIREATSLRFGARQTERAANSTHMISKSSSTLEVIESDLSVLIAASGIHHILWMLEWDILQRISAEDDPIRMVVTAARNFNRNMSRELWESASRSIDP